MHLHVAVLGSWDTCNTCILLNLVIVWLLGSDRRFVVPGMLSDQGMMNWLQLGSSVDIHMQSVCAPCVSVCALFCGHLCILLPLTMIADSLQHTGGCSSAGTPTLCECNIRLAHIHVYIRKYTLVKEMVRSLWTNSWTEDERHTLAPLYLSLSLSLSHTHTHCFSLSLYSLIF